MPVIKSMSRKDSSFGQLVSYLHKEDPVFGQLVGYINKDSARSSHVQTLLYNLPGVAPDDVNGITQAFKDNDAFRRERKNGVVQYHEIISFSPKDRSILARDPKILMDIARKYLDLRAPHSLAIARPHFDEKHIHVHLMISGNHYQSSETSRVSQKAFEQVKHQLNEYQINLYPELSNSVIEEHLKPELETKKKLEIGAENKGVDMGRDIDERTDTVAEQNTQAQIEPAPREELAAELELEMDDNAIPSPYWNAEDAKSEPILSPYWNTEGTSEESLLSPYWNENEEDDLCLD